jgi:hypothetical protein
MAMVIGSEAGENPQIFDKIFQSSSIVYMHFSSIEDLQHFCGQSG